MFSNSDESHINIPKEKFKCASAIKDLKGGFNFLTKTAIPKVKWNKLMVY